MQYDNKREIAEPEREKEREREDGWAMIKMNWNERTSAETIVNEIKCFYSYMCSPSVSLSPYISILYDSQMQISCSTLFRGKTTERIVIKKILIYELSVHFNLADLDSIFFILYHMRAMHTHTHTFTFTHIYTEWKSKSFKESIFNIHSRRMKRSYRLHFLWYISVLCLCVWQWDWEKRKKSDMHLENKKKKQSSNSEIPYDHVFFFFHSFSWALCFDDVA